MSEQFTKGGWSFDRAISRIVDAEGDTICAIGDSWSPYRNSGANAALIACAPEMYEMLSELSGQLADINANSHVKRIERLLSKARGEA